MENIFSLIIPAEFNVLVLHFTNEDIHVNKTELMIAGKEKRQREIRKN